MQPAHKAFAAVSTYYFILCYGALSPIHWESRLSLLLDKYNCSIWGFYDNVSATTYKEPGLYTIKGGNSFNCSNHLAYFLDMLGYVCKLTNGL